MNSFWNDSLWNKIFVGIMQTSIDTQYGTRKKSSRNETRSVSVFPKNILNEQACKTSQDVFKYLLRTMFKVIKKGIIKDKV